MIQKEQIYIIRYSLKTTILYHYVIMTKPFGFFYKKMKIFCLLLVHIYIIVLKKEIRNEILYVLLLRPLALPVILRHHLSYHSHHQNCTLVFMSRFIASLVFCVFVNYVCCM